MTLNHNLNPSLSNRELLPKILARVNSFVCNRILDFDSSELRKIVDIPSDSMMLFELVKQSEPSICETNPLAEAQIRGIKIKQEILSAEGGTISSEDAAKILNITRQGIDKRRKAGHLIGVSVGRRGYRYPVWQFAGDGILKGLDKVFSELIGHDPFMQIIFILNPNTRLDGDTPLNKLRSGDVASVIAAAKAYGEHGAA